MKKGAVSVLSFLVVGIFLINFASAVLIGNCNQISNPISGCDLYGLAGQTLLINRCYLYTGNVCCCDVYCNNVKIGDQQCGPPAPPPSPSYTWYLDVDADGYYNQTKYSTTGGTGWTTTVLRSGECNDSNPYVHSGVYENCSTSYDDNCNGIINENCSYATLSKPFFSNLIDVDTPISSATVGDTVLLRLGGQSLANTTINYTVSVYNSTNVVWWNPLSWFAKDWGNFQKISGSAYENFTLVRAELHRFDAVIAGTNKVNMSDNLTVYPASLSVDSNFPGGSNSFPVAVITLSANDSRLQNGTAALFTQASSDSDDLLTVTWDFGDGTPTVSCYDYVRAVNATKCNIPHTYAANGIYLVKLTVKEATRNQSNSALTKVYVFKRGINVIPVISQPMYGVSLKGTRIVPFNASGSYVANCSMGTISQLAFVAGNLNCSYIHAPNSKNVGNYNLALNWTLTTFGSNELISKYGDWKLEYNKTVEFTEIFSTGETHTAYLDLIYNP